MPKPTIIPKKDSSASSHRPDSMLLQWHVTNRCNLRCAHCYQESYGGDELSFDELMGILGQCESMVKTWRQEARQNKTSFRAQITLTGGEPFVRADFPRFLEEISIRKNTFSFAILTNGSLIDLPMARRLRALRPRFVQVSMEGGEATHNRIRGRGDFQRTLNAIRLLRRFGLRTMISFTVHKDNYREFTDVARIGIRLGVDRVWSDRLIPDCQGGASQPVTPLSPEDTQEFFQIMAEARREAEQRWFRRTEIAMHRALQFLVGGGTPYSCTAGNSLLTIMPNGDILPCRRMPIPVGNLRRSSLQDIYQENPLLKQLRNPEQLSQGCEGCAKVKQCRGGLKCLAHATTGNPFKRDPGCWLPLSQNTTHSTSMSAPRR